MLKSAILAIALTLPAARSATAQGACAVLWDPVRAVAFDSSVSTLPALAVRGDTVHVAWFGNDTTPSGSLGRSGLLYARSLDAGRSFSPPVRLLPPFTSLPGRMAASGDLVAIASGAIVDTFFGTVLFLSTDAGVGWSGPRPLVGGAYPELLFAGAGGFLLGHRSVETQSFGMLRSLDSGRSWHSLGERLRPLAAIAEGADRLHAVGPVPGASRPEVGYYSSRDSGAGWLGPFIVSPEDVVRSAKPGVAAAGERDIYASWIDTGAVLFRFSRNAGISWGFWSRLSLEPGAVTTQIAAAGELVAAIWERDIEGVRGIRARFSYDRGEQFCPIVTPGGGPDAREPALALADSIVHLVWIDESPVGSGVFYRRGVLPRNPAPPGLPPPAFLLGPTFPNPTNGVAKVVIEIPRATTASLTVFTVLGEEAASVGPRFYEPGRYVETLDVGGLPSGVYVYRLSAPGFAATRTMMVLR